ncbi:MAG TPA: apolipoprotein N-acyltransferase [Candidatus Acidoferrales bacterium]|nr:apolipoprotein N-acyltransferase [Candidatus Acidoferrales bacterium]
MLKYISLSILSALLLAGPFLQPMLFPIAWVAFVPLFWVIPRAASLRRAVLLGWLMGFVAHLVGFYWLVHTISVFGGFSYPVSGFIFLIYAALQGLQMAILAFLVRAAGFGPLQIFPAVFWVAIEFWFPLLFPWHLANTQSSFLWFIQIADLVGPYGASWVMMWCNAAIYALAVATRAERRARLLAVAYAALSVILSVAYGIQRLESVGEDMADARKVSVAAVQGNIDIDLKWDPAKAKQNLEQYLNLTRQVENTPVVIWPESSVEAWLPDDFAVLPPAFMPSLTAERAYFIFGAKSFQGRLGGQNFRAFNTAFITDRSGRLLGRYHKQVLLAFGEYLPFADILSLLPAMPFADGFTRGDGPRAFYLFRQIRLAPLICYEDLMPDLSRDFVKETKANLLVNLTNDAWYGRTVAPWQHARLAQLRAVETRRSLLRVTNTGITTLINAKGEIGESLPIFSPGVLKTDVEILDGETLYVSFGDWFAWSMTGMSLGILLYHLRQVLRTRNG